MAPGPLPGSTPPHTVPAIIVNLPGRTCHTSDSMTTSEDRLSWLGEMAWATVKKISVSNGLHTVVSLGESSWRLE